jgi:anti-anti-sigma factor
MQNCHSNEAAGARSAPTQAVASHIEVVQLHVDMRTHGTHMVLCPRGDLCVDTVPVLAAALDRVFDVGYRHVLVDLGDVDLLSAAGLSLLVQTRRRCHGNGGTLTLSDPSLMAARVLEICGVPLADRQVTATGCVKDRSSQLQAIGSRAG